ncbi:chorismate mutase [Methanoplanus limicola]|uniref:Chorismate mutase n=1 Tax=Methanoplanus limicola DSM 2279 TaxID=937775 RepID=H1YYZ0_9EURY|nr:chorismate mutase [Methanoplanus limicola]EHQ37062.1 chorismate mutase [Methanoplanus limicola DSM 2279]
MDLMEARSRIEEIDMKIISLISERSDLALKVAEAKRIEGGAVRDEEQREKVISRAIDKAREYGLDPEPVKEIFELLILMNEYRQWQIAEGD